MNNLLSRVMKIEQGLDVTRLSDEQIQRLDVRRLSPSQIQSLDVAKLTDEQAFMLDFSDLTDEQLTALRDRGGPELGAVIKSMSDDELRAAAEGRLCPWYPGYKGE